MNGRRANFLLRGLGLAAALALAAPSPLSAAEEVTFAAARVPPSQLRLRLAKAQGVTLKPEPGQPLRGRLVRPAGQGPFPAVVLLHGCAGLEPYLDAWAGALAAWGYLALAVDSFGPRGLAEVCSLPEGEADPGDLVMDAFGAFAYLRGLNEVDPERIGVIGWDLGATRALAAVRETGPQEDFQGGFRAAVAFYPACLRTGNRFTAPVLTLIGEADDWTPAGRCRLFVEASQGGPNPVTLTVYPGATHFFDNPRYGAGFHYAAAVNLEKTPPRGAFLAYDAAAHDAALRRVEAFLAMHLGAPRTPP
ncbi:MAG: dienelactone hydrolase family protein [Rhodospirillales bacterium]|nr:dienelactone hydrolase family protein [Rhodospirillales bacterium]